MILKKPAIIVVKSSSDEPIRNRRIGFPMQTGRNLQIILKQAEEERSREKSSK